MAFSEKDKIEIERVVDEYVKKRRPPEHLRDQVDLDYRIDGQSVEIFEIRPDWQNVQTHEEPVAKATYVQRRREWKVYWQRADLKWHRYDTDSEINSINEFLELIDEDPYGAFWG